MAPSAWPFAGLIETARSAVAVVRLWTSVEGSCRSILLCPLPFWPWIPDLTSTTAFDHVPTSYHDSKKNGEADVGPSYLLSKQQDVPPPGGTKRTRLDRTVRLQYVSGNSPLLRRAKYDSAI